MSKVKRPLSGATILVAMIAASMVLPCTSNASPLLGTVQPAGQVWAASDGSSWAQFSRLRPLVAGDHLRTGAGAYVLADLGGAGTLGMFSDSQVVVRGTSDAPHVGFKSGRVAFHISANSPLRIDVAGASLVSSGVGADGYVVATGAGDRIQLVLERGALSSEKEGHVYNMAAGEVLELKPVYVKLEGEQAGDSVGTAAAAAAAGKIVLSGTTVTAQGMQAIAVVAGAVGGALLASGGDRPASPSTPFE